MRNSGRHHRKGDLSTRLSSETSALLYSTLMLFTEVAIEWKWKMRKWHQTLATDPGAAFRFSLLAVRLPNSSSFSFDCLFGVCEINLYRWRYQRQYGEQNEIVFLLLCNLRYFSLRQILFSSKTIEKKLVQFFSLNHPETYLVIAFALFWKMNWLKIV